MLPAAAPREPQEMSSKAGKRPLRSLTAHEKLEAIRRVHDGESKASVARDIGVPESTLRGWCKNEDKISYLSRQSSPDTDESASGAEPKEKRHKLEDVLQPYNLSKKANGGALSPGSEFAKSDFDVAKPLNLNVKADGFKSGTPMTERERNRAELARLSVELGLNRPEMFLPNMNSGGSLSDLASNMGLLAQWNSLLLQHQQQPQQKLQQNVKITAPADTSTSMGGSTYPASSREPEHKQKACKLPKSEAQMSLDESIWYWLKNQPAMAGGQAQNGLPPATAVSSSSSNTPAVTSSSNVSFNDLPIEYNSNWFWTWYKQFASSYALQQQQQPQQSQQPQQQQKQQQQQQQSPDKPILYQQLTKTKEGICGNAENTSAEEKPTTPKNNTKARSVLDNLLLNNNNNVASSPKNDAEEALSMSEAVEHGEKFLEWLECCSEPSVTAVQIMQFRCMLNNIKNGAGRKNSDSNSRAKVKRK